MALHQEEHTLAIRQQLKQEGCRSLVTQERQSLNSLRAPGQLLKLRRLKATAGMD